MKAVSDREVTAGLKSVLQAESTLKQANLSISYYAKTKAEAVKKLHEEKYKLHFQEHVDPTSTKFIDWLRLWLETYMRNSLKQSTYVSYK